MCGPLALSVSAPLLEDSQRKLANPEQCFDSLIGIQIQDMLLTKIAIAA